MKTGDKLNVFTIKNTLSSIEVEMDSDLSKFTMFDCIVFFKEFLSIDCFDDSKIIRKTKTYLTYQVHNKKMFNVRTKYGLFLYYNIDDNFYLGFANQHSKKVLFFTVNDLLEKLSHPYKQFDPDFVNWVLEQTEVLKSECKKRIIKE